MSEAGRQANRCFFIFEKPPVFSRKTDSHSYEHENILEAFPLSLVLYTRLPRTGKIIVNKHGFLRKGVHIEKLVDGHQRLLT